MSTETEAAPRVHVTGMAWTTALGTGLGEVWRRLVDGHGGVTTGAQERPATGAGPGGETAPPRRLESLAVTTARAALHDSGGSGIAALVLGGSLGAHLDDPELAAHDTTVAVSRELGLTAPPHSVSTACSSGSDAIGLAATMIRAGVVDSCVCGGVDLLGHAKTLGHQGLGTLSATGPKPFDADRDGIALGEGAGFLVLEAEHRLDGRATWGEVTGWGVSNDARGLTAPDTTGGAAALAARRALAKADATPSDIGVVNAHGTGTVANDATESACYAELFGRDETPVVFATKAAFGHTLGATGAIEAIAVLLALTTETAPPVPQTTTVMPELTLRLPTTAPAAVTTSTGLSLTLGFGGFNTCLVLERGSRGLKEWPL